MKDNELSLDELLADVSSLLEDTPREEGKKPEALQPDEPGEELEEALAEKKAKHMDIRKSVHLFLSTLTFSPEVLVRLQMLFRKRCTLLIQRVARVSLSVLRVQLVQLVHF